MIPQENHKSLAPALDAGLDVMEYLIRHQEAGFNELCKLLPMSKASVSRILKTLAERGYARKDDQSGKWLPGPRMGTIGMTVPVAEIIRRESPAILSAYTDRTGLTALGIHWSGEEFQVVAKEEREGGIVMMDVGRVIRDLSNYPWGWIFYLSLDAAGQRRMDAYLDNPDLVKRRLDAWRLHFESKGYMLDNQEIYEHRLRFGAPIYDRGGRVVGAIGTSCWDHGMTTEKIDAIGAELIRHAEKFTAKFAEVNQ